MKKKRTRWNSNRLFHMHVGIFAVINMLIWLNMFVTIKVMNDQLSFNVFEKLITDSMVIGAGWTTVLILHYVALNFYQASKWRRHERRHMGYEEETEQGIQETPQRSITHLEDRYDEGDGTYYDESIGLKNENHK